MARTNNKGGNSAKLGVYSAFTKSQKHVPFTKTKASPYKFLGKLLGGGGGGGGSKLGGIIGGIAAGPMGMLMGSKMGGGGAAAGAAQGVSANPVAAAAQQKAMGTVGQKAIVGGGMATPSAMVQRNEFEKKNSPITQRRSPLKATDRVLVEGAYDAASGHGTVKYGATAGARAWTDMVNTVEDTVNRSSKAMAAKDRRRQKVYDRSRKKYRRWYEAPQRNIPGVNDISNQRHHDITHPHGLNN